MVEEQIFGLSGKIESVICAEREFFKQKTQKTMK